MVLQLFWICLMVSKNRHILKTITWRIIGTIDTILLSWFITGSLTLGFSIGGYMKERGINSPNMGLIKKRTVKVLLLFIIFIRFFFHKS